MDWGGELDSDPPDNSNNSDNSNDSDNSDNSDNKMVRMSIGWLGVISMMVVLNTIVEL